MWPFTIGLIRGHLFEFSRELDLVAIGIFNHEEQVVANAVAAGPHQIGISRSPQ